MTLDFLSANLGLNQLRPMKYRHGHWSKPGSLMPEGGAPQVSGVA